MASKFMLLVDLDPALERSARGPQETPHVSTAEPRPSMRTPAGDGIIPAEVRG
jgi:hypothetical protein